MSVDIVTMRDCASNYGVFNVIGSTGNKYTVSMNGSEGPAFCTCEGFKWSKLEDKSCRHISELWKGKACFYNPQWHEGQEEPEYRPTSYTYDGGLSDEESCPACGGPTVVVKRAV